jgi:hypothetical protein
LKKLIALIFLIAVNVQAVTPTPTPVRVGPVVVDTPGAAQHVVAAIDQSLVKNLPATLAGIGPTAVAQAVATITPLVGSGGSTCPGVLKTGNYTISTSDCLIVVNSGSAVTMTLPAATGSGVSHTIKTISYGYVRLAKAGSDTIDGDDSITLTVPESSIEVVDWAAGLWAIK